MKYNSLSPSTKNEICNVLNDAFSDYVIPFSIPTERFERINERRGSDYKLSTGAYHEDVLVGFIINACDTWNEKKTIYDCFTGVVPEHKRNGIANQMFEFSFSKSQKLGMEQYMLEVITSNFKAHELYFKKGFNISRHFNIFREKISNITPVKLKCNIRIEKTELPDWDMYDTFQDILPSWQNSHNSIKRTFDDFDIFHAYQQDVLAGYMIAERNTGDIPQLAVKDSYRRNGIASALLKEFCIGRCKDSSLSFLNIDSRCESFNNFAKAIKLPTIVNQYEMIKEF